MPLADRQQVQQLLHAMRSATVMDERVGALKKLLAQLNYDATRKPLPANFHAEVQNQLVARPTIIATGGDDGSFLIVHVQLASERLSRTTERAIVTALLKDYPYALFVFSNKDNSRWHLLNVKVARKEASDENRDTKLRRLHRRISIAPEDRLRTATERVEKLDLALINPELFGLSPLAIQEAHDDAFDVEAVTKQFFQEYKRIFDHVEDAITGLRGPDKRRLYVQRLFNRLMFIAFIQKKGWLKFAGMEENEYLEGLWRDYQAKKKDDSNFYTDRLAHLFFHGLNNAAAIDMLATNRGRSAPDSFLQRRIGDVPYLNGGLFEKSDDGTDEADAGIVIPDKAINSILHELFERFNFTVTESTPLDVEVAVDPEMLGKVFEELVTGRHESGSYYTPKPIVSFMCREALKGYLETKCRKEKHAAIARFVDEHDASGIADGEAMLDALKSVKCCDPACGSGAYLLGMMHELLDLRQTLFKTDKKLDPVSVYQRKLETIQTNVYGVDLDPFAVNIARLRLWLSLAVDFEGDAPPPLPNLDFKIEPGDSLAAPDPSDSGQLQLQKPLVDGFLGLKREYLLAHSTRKKELKKDIDKKREQIKAWTHTSGGLPVNAFDWQVEFAEVFIEGGFDVVLANPPYVRQELIKDQKSRLKEVFPNIFSGTADLYCYFYGRGIQLLASSGMLAYISSNKWLRSGYGERLREQLGSQCQIRSVTDFGELPVFDAATFPMIFIARRAEPNTSDVRFTCVPTLDAPYPDIKALIEVCGTNLPVASVRGAQWRTSTGAAALLVERMEATGLTLNDYTGGRILNGVKPGLNRAFVIEAGLKSELIRDSSDSRQFLYPFLDGDDVRKWRTQSRQAWLIYLRWTDQLDSSHPIMRYLRGFKSELERRDGVKSNGPCPWFALSRPRAEAFQYLTGKKLLFPDIAKESRFTLDASGVMISNTVYYIPGNDLFLLAVLNSKYVWEYCRERLTVIGDAQRGGRLRFFRQFVEKLPVPNAGRNDRQRLEALAQKCLDARGLGCEQWEREIDELVAALYRL